MSKYLFVCTANRDRSRTAEQLFKEIYPDKEFRSAGTNRQYTEHLGTTLLTEELLEWAEQVLVMEQHHLDVINERYGRCFEGKITVLQIPDVYDFNAPELRALLKERVSAILE